MFRRKIKDIQEHAKNRGISMERRLFLYWLIMVLAVMTAVFVVLIVAGVFSNDAGKLGGTLSVQQKNTTMTFNKLIDTLNAQNLALSEQITREVSDVLETEERTFKDLDNNPELITRIEERMCFYLQTIVAHEAAVVRTLSLMQQRIQRHREQTAPEWGCICGAEMWVRTEWRTSISRFSAESQMLQEKRISRCTIAGIWNLILIMFPAMRS
mgnify:CR=1 FL=1